MTPGVHVLAGAAFAPPAVPQPALHWPLSGVSGPLPAVETTPGSVRAEARQALALWDLPEAVDVIDLVATELVTNAVRASRPMRQAGQAPVIRVCLLTNRLTARVEVWDEAPGFPVLRDADTDAENGRGLILVNDLTGGMWGWSRVAALLPAKCVWAQIPLAAASPETNDCFSPAAQDAQALDMRPAPTEQQPQQATGASVLAAATAG